MRWLLFMWLLTSPLAAQEPGEFPKIAFPPPQAGDYSREPSSGMVVSRTRILVLLKETALPECIPKVVRFAHPKARLGGCLAEAKTLLIVLPNSKNHRELLKAMEKLTHHPDVQGASPDFVTKKSAEKPASP